MNKGSALSEHTYRVIFVAIAKTYERTGIQLKGVNFRGLRLLNV